MDLQSKIKEASIAIENGDITQARAILIKVIQQDPKNADAWLAMADAVDNPDHAIECLERALRLEPDNEIARRKLAELKYPSSQMPAFLLEYVGPEPEDTYQASHYKESELGTETHAPIYDSYQPQVETSPINTAQHLTAPALESFTPGGGKSPEKRGPTQRIEEGGKKRSGRWLEIALGAVAVMCLCVVVIMAIGQFGPSLTSQAGPTPTLEDVQVVIYENMYAANAEDIDAYMDTIHPRARGRSVTRSTMLGLFEKFDLFYNITWLSVHEVTEKEARVGFALETRKVNGPAFRNNWITGVMILRLDGRKWKIYDQEVDSVTYID